VLPAVGMDESGKIVWRKRLSRPALMLFLAKLPRYALASQPVGVRLIGRAASVRLATR
jgi:hypothetical protein